VTAAALGPPPAQHSTAQHSTAHKQCQLRICRVDTTGCVTTTCSDAGVLVRATCSSSTHAEYCCLKPAMPLHSVSLTAARACKHTAAKRKKHHDSSWLCAAARGVPAPACEPGAAGTPHRQGHLAQIPPQQEAGCCAWSPWPAAVAHVITLVVMNFMWPAHVITSCCHEFHVVGCPLVWLRT
jgi:hypothetical protein